MGLQNKVEEFVPNNGDFGGSSKMLWPNVAFAENAPVSSLSANTGGIDTST
jgi:hypothetical protein